MTFGKSLRAWRIKEHLSQKEAAAILDLNVKTYQNWEYGRTEPTASGCRKCVENKMGKYELTGHS